MSRGGPGPTVLCQLLPVCLVQVKDAGVVTEVELHPGAPIGKKHVWFDARTGLPLVMVSYDRRGDIFRSFEGAYSVYDDGKGRVMDGARPYWSWCLIHADNVQTGRMTRLEQLAGVPGHRMHVNDHNIYEKYLPVSALQSRGA